MLIFLSILTQKFLQDENELDMNQEFDIELMTQENVDFKEIIVPIQQNSYDCGLSVLENVE